MLGTATILLRDYKCGRRASSCLSVHCGLQNVPSSYQSVLDEGKTSLFSNGIRLLLAVVARGAHSDLRVLHLR